VGRSSKQLKTGDIEMREMNLKSRGAAFLFLAVVAGLLSACSPIDFSDSDKSDSGISGRVEKFVKSNASGHLDATNSDTLRESIALVTASMSERDRIALAQDIELIFKSARGNQPNAYSLRTDLFPDTSINMIDHSDVSLSIGNELTNKSPAQIHKVASEIRQQALLKRINELLQEIDTEEFRTKVQIICTRSAMDPTINSRGHRAIGWSRKLQACQSRLGQLPQLRDEMLAHKKLIESFDFSLNSFDTPENFEVFNKLQDLKNETDCSENGAFCPSDAELRASQESYDGSVNTQLDTDPVKSCMTGTGESEAFCSCLVESYKSNLPPQLLSKIGSRNTFDESFDGWAKSNLTPVEQGEFFGAGMQAGIACSEP
jgi:hypothetical protein